jgi:hypothetical protein
MMRRLSKFAALAAATVFVVGAFASTALASPGARHATRAAATSEWGPITYNAEAYYGEVKCTGKTVTSKKYPGGKDVEKCEAVSGTLAHMVAGKSQKAFENTEGGFVSEWESDSGSGKKTTEYSYNVNKKLTKFKIIAIYAPPEEA